MTTDTAGAGVLTSTDAGALVTAAFARIAKREFDAARPIVERALEIEPRNGMVAHAKAHLDTDSRATAEGAAYLRTFLTQEEPLRGINVHNAWHLAALEVELARPRAALDWHERVVAPNVPEYAMTFYSAVTLLWRLHVYGWAGTLPWEPLRAAALALDEPSAIVQVGRAMTYIATGDEQSLTSLLDRLRGADPIEQAVTAEVTIPIIGALRAFWQGDYRAARDLFAPIASALARLSEFPENRTPIEDTYLESLFRTGRGSEAEPRLRERIQNSPRALPRDLYWLGRAQHGQGCREEAAVTLRIARQRWDEAEPDSPEIGALDALLAA